MIRALEWAAGLGALAVLVVLVGALAAPVLAWFTLSEAHRPGAIAASSPGLAQEVLLAAVSAPLFVLVAVWLNVMGALRWRELVWYAILGAVAVSRWLPRPEENKNPAWRWRRVHYAGAALVGLFALAHVANHLAAIQSLSAHVAIQNVLRKVYRQPVFQALLLTSMGVLMLSGARLIWAARSYRFTELRSLQLLSGANLLAFFVSHLGATLVLGPRILKVDTTFAWATGGAGGMLGSPAALQLLPYYVLGVGAFFVHLGSAARWSLIPVLGQAGARRTARVLMLGGMATGVALVFPMLGVRMH